LIGLRLGRRPPNRGSAAMRNAMDLSAFDDRLLASFVLGSPDYDAQLFAIRGLLRLHRQADEALSNEIKAIEAFAAQASGDANEQAVDEWVDRLHQFVFQDAAHSMSAVGMLAPFVESLFKQAFPGLRNLLDRNGRLAVAQVRCKMPKSKRWNCEYALNWLRRLDSRPTCRVIFTRRWRHSLRTVTRCSITGLSGPIATVAPLSTKSRRRAGHLIGLAKRPATADRGFSALATRSCSIA